MFTYSIPNYGGSPRTVPTASADIQVVDVRSWELPVEVTGHLPVSTLAEKASAVMPEQEDADRDAAPPPQQCD